MTKTPAKSTKAAKAAKPTKAKKPSPPAAQPTGEQLMRDMQKVLGKQTFANIAEVNAFMQNLMGAGGQLLGDPGGPESLKDEAQDLAFEAMEAATAAKARSLAKKALAKDPDCVDALVLLAGLDANSTKAAIEGLQKAVEAGERSLGAKFLKANKGHFWLILETRPYMRALACRTRTTSSSSKTVDFRSFRTMHASLMRRFGARLEVARDNMGHAGGTGSITLDVYSKTWRNERVEAVTRVVEAVFAEPDEEEKKRIATPLKGLPDGGIDKEWEPFWEP
jgi:hypothetical protein